MTHFGELLARAADLVEAEGRTLRASGVRFSVALGIIVLAVLSGAAGLALVLTGMYLSIAANAGRPAGALLTGMASLAIGGVLVWIGNRIGEA
ncbi:MAG: hypothetical protein IPJ41_03835 [Phycisphaerales bacterium]|nr:hypothetical protein [Phycisphaerales bacterium]